MACERNFLGGIPSVNKMRTGGGVGVKNLDFCERNMYTAPKGDLT